MFATVLEFTRQRVYEGRPIALHFPKKNEFQNRGDDAGVKGDTASGNVTKEAKTDVGFIVNVPIF